MSHQFKVSILLRKLPIFKPAEKPEVYFEDFEDHGNVAIVISEEQEITTERVLERAFEFCQNGITEKTNGNYQWKSNTRSVSVGDVLVLATTESLRDTSYAFEVMPTGWRRVKLVSKALENVT